MRCQCCNRGLNDYESTVKYKASGDYADLCNKCRKEIHSESGVEFIGRTDLQPYEQHEEEGLYNGES